MRKHTSKRIYRRALVLIFSGLLGLTLSVSAPALSVERVAATQARPEINWRRGSGQVEDLKVAENSLDLVQEGRKLYSAGKFSEAAKVWQQAAQIYEIREDKLNQAMALSNLSLTYQQLGQWKQASVAIDKSLSILPSGQTTEELRIRAQSLDIQGRLQLEVGRSQQAADTWKEAAKIYAGLGDKNAQTQSQINQAQALQALGRYRLAKETLDQVAQTLHNQPDSTLKVSGLRSLGDVRRQLGDLEQSKKCLEESLQVAKKIQSPQEQGAVLLSLGNTAQALAKRAKDFQEEETAKKETECALNYYKQAETTSTSPLTKLQAQLNQLSLLVESEQRSDAQALLPQIQSGLNALPPSRAAIYAKINFAESLTRLRETSATDNPSWSEITQHLTSALQEARMVKDNRSEAYALGKVGNIYEKQALKSTDATQKAQLLAEANAKTQQALILAEDVNANSPEIAYNLEWQMARLLNAEGNNRGAIAAYDTAVGTLKSLRTDLGAINRDVKFSFQENVEPVYRQYLELLLQADSPTPENLDTAREVIDALQVAELDNFFRDACSDVEPVALDTVVKKYDPTSAILYSIVLEKELGVIYKLPDRQNLSYYKTTLSDANQVLDDTVKAIDDALKEAFKIFNELNQTAKMSKLNRNEKKFQDTLQKVYEWLIPDDVDAALAKQQVKTLVFVLDGALQKIPMSALYDGKQYLVEKAGVALSLGLQLLDPKPLARNQIKVLAAGLSEAPEIPKNDGTPYAPLPHVKEELDQIERTVSAKVLRNEDFTVDKFKKEINSTFNVVHLATHGEFSSNPEKTFIVTNKDRIKVNELDNLLRISDKKRNIPIELLVLSACETAAGDRRAALGLAGMAVQAGARSTIASLWNTADDAAAALMGPFYKAIKNPKVTKAEALRRAQLDLLNNLRDQSSPPYRNPAYWAPFVLVGNWL